MANNNSSVMSGIRNSWSLISFAKSHGKMQVAPFANGESGAPFQACVFTDPVSNVRTFVGFSSKLGELTPKQISERQHDLQVVELESGSYKLCAVGSNSWQDVALDI